MSSDESENVEETDVDLGLLEPVDEDKLWKLHRCYFPSKFGGKPAWLNPKLLPSSDQLLCPVCSSQLQFLLQLYAPVDDNENAFHRTIYVFCCKNDSCYKNESKFPLVVLRCQLGKNNDFYDKDPPNYDNREYIKTIKGDFNNLCEVCGCSASKHCSSCKTPNYCSKEHQKLHWKHHKNHCSKNSITNDEEIFKNECIFPCHEIVMEPEKLNAEDENTNTEAESRFENLSTKYSMTDLEQFANTGNKIDKSFENFRETISQNKDQVVRYDRKGKPLWCSSENKLSDNLVPDCNHCGSKRCYEFQIMPQLLNYMQIEHNINTGIDWGMIAVYTCEENCISSTNNAYLNEFLHAQNFSSIWCM